MPRRRSVFTFAAVIITTIIFFCLIFTPHSAKPASTNTQAAAAANVANPNNDLQQKERTPAELKSIKDYDPIDALSKSTGPSQETVMGAPIMGAMNNETIRAEVGRASWKLLHTILQKYPEKPTAHERETLSSFIHLFSRVYPCGQCASHFQDMLRKFPPQTSSREAASQWGCFVHNQVNERLGKEIFDCSEISNKYACGCADDETTAGEAEVRAKEEYVEEAAAKKARLAVKAAKEGSSKDAMDTKEGTGKDVKKGDASEKSKKSEKPVKDTKLPAHDETKETKEAKAVKRTNETKESKESHEGNEVLDNFRLELPEGSEKDKKGPLVLEKGG